LTTAAACAGHVIPDTAPSLPVTRLLTLWRLLRLITLPGSLLTAHARAYGQLAGLELARE
jgi:hypothetical protein